jgi:hypothetical protein
MLDTPAVPGELHRGIHNKPVLFAAMDNHFLLTSLEYS